MQLSRRLVGAFAFLALVVLMGTIGYRAIVGGSWLDCLYMTLITISTVGYGEVIPGLDHNPAGRIFTMLVILVGAGILVYLMGTITALIVEGQLTDMIRRRRMQKEIEKIGDHIVVCGTGATGIHAVEELSAVGEEFVVVERDADTLKQALERSSFLYVEGDATEDEVLLEAGIKRARGILTLLPTDRDNLYVTFTARQLNPSIRIISRGVEPHNRNKCRRAGADAVVYPNVIGGLRMVSELIRPQAVNFLDRMLRPGAEMWRITEVKIEPGSPLAGRDLGSLDLPARVGIPVLALSEDQGRKITYYPPASTVLSENAHLIVLAERRHLEAIQRVLREG